MPIATNRLILRRFERRDMSDVLGFVSQASVARTISGRIQATETGIRDYIDLQNSYAPFEEGKVFELAVERKEDGRVVGLVGLIRRSRGQGEIGWVLGAEYRGQGYATEAAGALLEYGFRSLSLHRIHADTDRDNIASLRVMERLGMRRETLPGDSSYEAGEQVDKYGYTLLVDEWDHAAASGRRDKTAGDSVRSGG